MTILFATPAYVDSGNPTTGFPAYLYRVSQALLAMGHEPIIMTFGNCDMQRKDNGVEVYTICEPVFTCKNQCMSFVIDAVCKSWIMNKKIEELSHRRHIDIIQFTSLMGLATLYKGKIPAVLRLSSYARIYYSTHISMPKKIVETMAFLERKSAQKCMAVYAPCRATAVKFGTDIRRKVYVLETPFQNDIKQYDYSCADKLKGKKYFFFFGILSPEKGIGIIAEILYQFLDRCQDYYFVFAGQPFPVNGKNPQVLLRNSAKEYADRVIFFKPLPHEQLYPLIMKAECIVLPYFNDNLSNACLEAMSFGKVVIGTDGGSFEQVIVHDHSGVLCRRNDAKDLLDKMFHVVKLSEEKKQEIGRNAKNRVDRLRPEIAVKKLLHFYKAVISK